MQHDGIAYIDTAMAHAGGIVGALEKHKVARFDLRRLNRSAEAVSYTHLILEFVTHYGGQRCHQAQQTVMGYKFQNGLLHQMCIRDRVEQS